MADNPKEAFCMAVANFVEWQAQINEHYLWGYWSKNGRFYIGHPPEPMILINGKWVYISAACRDVEDVAKLLPRHINHLFERISYGLEKNERLTYQDAANVLAARIEEHLEERVNSSVEERSLIAIIEEEKFLEGYKAARNQLDQRGLLP